MNRYFYSSPEGEELYHLAVRIAEIKNPQCHYNLATLGRLMTWGDFDSRPYEARQAAIMMTAPKLRPDNPITDPSHLLAATVEA